MTRTALLVALLAGTLASVAVRGCGGEGTPAKGPAPRELPAAVAALLDYTPADALLDPYPGGEAAALAAADTLASALTPALVALASTPAACAALRVLDGVEGAALDAMLETEGKAAHRAQGYGLFQRAAEAKGDVLRAMEPAPCAMLR